MVLEYMTENIPYISHYILWGGLDNVAMEPNVWKHLHKAILNCNADIGLWKLKQY